MVRSRSYWVLSTILFAQHVLAQAAKNATRPSNSTMAANSTSAAKTSTTPKPKPKPKMAPDTRENWRLSEALMITWGALCVALMLYVIAVLMSRYVRTVSCLNNDSQRYFNEPTPFIGFLKKHLLDAPLFRKRHHREFHITKTIDAGTLPSRMQTIFLVSYIATMAVLTVININWSAPKAKVYVYFMKRTGALALINMIPLFLLAARNNPLIWLTGITFDTYNQIHRWIGRVVVLEIVAHGVTYVIKRHETGGWASLRKAETMGYVQAGTVAGGCMVIMFLTSHSAFRHKFYEIFLHLHFVLAAAVVAGVFIHIKGYVGHTNTICGVLAIWCIERGCRLIRLIYRNIGNGGTHAEVTALPGNAVRVRMRMARPWNFHSGQHAYIYLPSIGWWTAHPFSVAWSDEDDDEVMSTSDQSYLPKVKGDLIERKNSYIYFVIRRRTGFTEKLWRKATTAPGGVFRTRAFVEGPYSQQRLHSYGTVLLFAAGVGITHQVPHVRELVRGYSNGTVAARKVVLVWVIQTPEHLEWIREWMTQILGLPRRREILKILLFVTRPKNTKEIYSPSSSVQMFPGKPNIQAIVDQEVAQSIGAVGVSVCGIGAVADDVRQACRSWMGKVNIDFEEESFSW